MQQLGQQSLSCMLRKNEGEASSVRPGHTLHKRSAQHGGLPILSAGWSMRAGGRITEQVCS